MCTGRGGFQKKGCRTVQGPGGLLAVLKMFDEPTSSPLESQKAKVKCWRHRSQALHSSGILLV